MSKLGVVVTLLGALFMCGCKVQEVKGSSDTEPKIETFYNFKGVGNEPGWNILIGDSQIVFHHINQPKKVTFKKLRIVPVMDVAGVAYYAEDENGNKIHVQVFKEDCRDTMADKTWLARVEVRVETGATNSEREESSFSGCGNFMDDRLTGTWLLKSLKGKKIKVNKGDSKVPQVMFTNGKDVGANMGCNGIGGAYELWNNTLYFGKDFMSTLMLCEGKMALEKEFSKQIIGKALKYAFVGDELIFSDFDNKVIMTLRKD